MVVAPALRAEMGSAPVTQAAPARDPAPNVSLAVALPPAQAEALSQLVKRLLRHNLDRTGLNLADPHRPGDADDMEAALHVLRRALANEGYDPR